MSVAVFIEHRARRGCRGEVRAVWERSLRPAIETNDGHEAYSYMFDADDPDIFRALQHYTDDEAAAAYLTTPAHGAYIAAVEDMLVGPTRVLRREVIWTKPNPAAIRAARHMTMVVFPGESHEYRTTRNALLELEIGLRREMEAVAAARRALPAGGEIPEDYVFDELDHSGTVTQVKLSELFAPGKDALVIYNYMFPRHAGDLRPGPRTGESARLAARRWALPVVHFADRPTRRC